MKVQAGPRPERTSGQRQRSFVGFLVARGVPLAWQTRRRSDRERIYDHRDLRRQGAADGLPVPY
jgi:hypothetical protein